jgi:hypothetical protein
MRRSFGIDLALPEMVSERSEIILNYASRDRTTFDIASAGRGLQQALLLLAYIHANPGCVLLIDEPDAHLEILRQREIYQLVNHVAEEQHSQVICASHSEVVLQEAAERDIVVAFVGKPHRIDNRGSQVLKALRDIPFDHYYQAETAGWVLYLEGSTDLNILNRLAERLHHPAASHLERPFVQYAANDAKRAQNHFHGLREAKPDLAGLALFDRLERGPVSAVPELRIVQWRRREIENYLCTEATLMAYARGDDGDDLLGHAESEHRADVMHTCILDFTKAFETIGRPSPWSPDIKATDDFLDPLFKRYFQGLGMPNLMRKSNYHELAAYLPLDELDPEVKMVLDQIDEIAATAKGQRP